MSDPIKIQAQIAVSPHVLDFAKSPTEVISAAIDDIRRQVRMRRTHDV